MFKICQGTCFCAANSDSNIRDARETVLYCFGEVDIDIILKKSYFKRMFQVVLKKDSLRGEEASAKISSQQTLDEYHLQLAQLVITFLLIFLVLIVLLLIRFSDTHEDDVDHQCNYVQEGFTEDHHPDEEDCQSSGISGSVRHTEERQRISEVNIQKLLVP